MFKVESSQDSSTGIHSPTEKNRLKKKRRGVLFTIKVKIVYSQNVLEELGHICYLILKNIEIFRK